MEPPPTPHQTNTDTRTQILQMKCVKNCPGRGGGHRSHYLTSIQLALTIPRFLKKRLAREGFPRAEISLGALRSFFFCLFAFADAHSECAWSAPQDRRRRPGRADAHTPPASLGAGLRTPGLQTCAPPLAAPARQLSEHLTRPHPASPSPISKSQIHGCAPGKVPTTLPRPKSRSAPFPPPGGVLPRSLTSNAPFTSAGGRKPTTSQAARAETVKRRKGKRGGGWPSKGFFFPPS